MGKRLTYEQRVRRKMRNALLGYLPCNSQGESSAVCVLTSLIGDPLSGWYTRPRDAWRSAWRNLRRKK